MTDAAYKAFINSCATQLYEKFEGKLFEGLPEKVLSACTYASSMRLYSDAVDVKDLNAALSIGRDKLSSVILGIKVYGYYSPSLSDVPDRSSFKSLLSTVNTIRDFRNTLLAAMESFRSGEKLIASLP
ncbi:hypothetical protein [Symbiopectobacterium sp.]|uniref:hypothetical protein n=1 Tax=Symbiopectobacterium sp. TaxID=2952789 RepID=UPI003F2E8A1C